MSEANGAATPPRHVLSTGRVTFACAAGEFTLPLVEAMREVNAIADRHQKAGSANFEHLDDLAAWVEQRHGVRPTPEESQDLWAALPELWSDFRTRRRPPSATPPTSAPSTASTPAS